MHCAFVDDTLPGVELVRMQRHMTECESCAVLDARVRRSLMLVRNLPGVELSSDFSARLEARLRESKLHQEHAGASFRTVAAFGAVASIVMLAYVGEALRTSGARPRDVVLPPVIAAIPSQAQIQVDTTPAPAIVASVSAGVPIWPVGLLVEEQSPAQLVSYTEAR